MILNKDELNRLSERVAYTERAMQEAGELVMSLENLVWAAKVAHARAAHQAQWARDDLRDYIGEDEGQ